MNWFKCVVLAGLLLTLHSCSHPEKESGSQILYFDLKGYFQREAGKLNQQQRQVLKTVSVQNKKEVQRLNVDFEKEFALFLGADINKASWRDAYEIRQEGNQEIYETRSEKIPVKQVILHRENGKITYIRISQLTTNLLYRSADTLSYYPDSLYLIQKTQKITLLSEKKYRIEGLIGE